MAIIVPEHRLLFILTPRTASSAVGKVLRRELGGHWLPREHIRNRRGKVVVRTKHSTVRDLVSHGVISGPEMAELTVFTCVRNPFDRLVSVYHKRRDEWSEYADDPESWVHFNGRRGMRDLHIANERSFTEWIEHRYGGNPVRRMAMRVAPLSMYRRFVADTDVVMRFERLQDDFDRVLASVGLDPIEVPVFNRTETRPVGYRDFYDDRSRTLVEHTFRWDLETFDYAF